MSGALRRERAEPPIVRLLLVAIALGFLGFVLLLPLGMVFASAFEKGLSVYLAALSGDDALSAMSLSVFAATTSVMANSVFGIAAAWALSRYEFWGKSLLVTLIDLPFSVSPVVSGLVFVLLFGSQGWFGPWLAEHGVKVLFATPGIVIVTTFITFPLVARETLSVMQAQGKDEEEAALTMGASGVQIFFRVTLPKIKWALAYGVILCNARAMGEFGAVSVVSGHIRGQTNTMPLHVEVLYNEYQFTAAFAVASVLACLALATIALKSVVEHLSKPRGAREP